MKFFFYVLTCFHAYEDSEIVSVRPKKSPLFRHYQFYCWSVDDERRVYESVDDERRVCESVDEEWRVCESVDNERRVCESVDDKRRVCELVDDFVILAVCMELPDFFISLSMILISFHYAHA